MDHDEKTSRGAEGRRRGIETERRFLIVMPERDFLDALGGDAIEQIYIEPGEKGTAERVRARTHGGDVTYTRTVKRRIGAISAEEDESVIDGAEYSRLAGMREAGTSPIRKTRYVLPYRGYDFEIDVYPEWPHAAVMEVEMADENDDPEIPPSVKVIREVSGDRSLSNHALSRHFPTEDELLSEK